MAPGAIDSISSSETHNNKGISNLYSHTTPLAGFRTSGQHEPLFSELLPYSSFPASITGPSVWTRSDFVNPEDSEKWIYRWNPSELAEISTAIDAFIASNVPLATITKASFPLPTVGPFLSKVREDLVNGKGFILFKGWPVEEWGVDKAAVAYMGIGTYIGHFISQNRLGHVLGHVKDLGDDPTDIASVRIYRTSARQFFHCDDGDIVGLLCLAKAFEGGESDIVSSHHLYNILQQERPDVLETLAEPNWYFDRKGEVSKGQKEYIRCAIYYFWDGKVVSKWDPYYVKSLGRFVEKGLVPALSEKQLEALKVLEETALREALHMVLEVGDIQFVNNNFMFHARTEYKDFPPPAPRRHLMRLWLSTPESEGGWKLPFKDSGEIKRGGVQVDDTPEKTPMDGE